MSAEDFTPLPCSHPHCFSLAFYLMIDGSDAVSINKLVPVGEMLDAMSNRLFYGLTADEHDHLKQMVYRLWSGSRSTRF